MSSPRDLSGDEVDIEESISSKMVEVDEIEEEEMQKGTAVIDDESLSLRDMRGEYSISSQYHNVAAVSSELPNDEVDEENDVEEEADYDYEEDFEVSHLSLLMECSCSDSKYVYTNSYRS